MRYKYIFDINAGCLPDGFNSFTEHSLEKALERAKMMIFRGERIPIHVIAKPMNERDAERLGLLDKFEFPDCCDQCRCELAGVLCCSDDDQNDVWFEPFISDDSYIPDSMRGLA